MKKLLCIFIAVMLMIFAFAACTKTTTEEAKKEEASAANETKKEETSGTTEEDTSADAATSPYGRYEETVTYTLGRPAESGLPEGVTTEKNALTDAILEKLNIKTEIIWEVGWAEYTQKCSVAISSGDIPDTMRVTRVLFNQMVDAGMVADLTESYEKCTAPFFKEQYESFSPTNLTATTVDGKLMGIPACGETVPDLLWIRQDWLDKLGLDPPTTIDDIINIGKEFIEKDPGGNGEGKTIALGSVIDGETAIYGFAGLTYVFNPVFGIYGAIPGHWIDDGSGNAIYGSITDEMKPALMKISEMYELGVLDKQFPLKKGSDIAADIEEGLTGMIFGPWWNTLYPLNKAVQKNPDADWRAYNAPLDSEGKTYRTTQDPTQDAVQVVNVDYEHPEAILKVLNLEWDIWKGTTPEWAAIYDDYAEQGFAWTIMPLVIEVRYSDETMRAGKSINDALSSGSTEGMRSDNKALYTTIKQFLDGGGNPGSNIPGWQNYTSYALATQLYSGDAWVYKPAVYYGITPTMETKWESLEKMERETMLKIITGEVSIDEFDNFVKQWKELGGDEITAEVNAAIGN